MKGWKVFKVLIFVFFNLLFSTKKISRQQKHWWKLLLIKQQVVELKQQDPPIQLKWEQWIEIIKTYSFSQNHNQLVKRKRNVKKHSKIIRSTPVRETFVLKEINKNERKEYEVARVKKGDFQWQKWKIVLIKN